MAVSNRKPGRVEDSAALRDEWVDRLRGLVDTVKAWAEELGWSTRIIPKAMKESRLGPYEAPALLAQKEFCRVLLDPVARFAPGTDGIVDLYLMPAYDDIASLYLVGGKWRVLYVYPDKGAVAKVSEADSRPLSKETIRRVLDEMSAHAMASP